MIKMSSNDELEAIRRKRLLELRKRLTSEQKSDQEKDFEKQKEAVLRQILTSEARQRLNNLKLVKSGFVQQIELQLIQIAQSGKIRLPIDDAQLKRILLQLQPAKKEITFRRI